MRPEQIAKLVTLEEELVDVFSTECKPKDWPGLATAQQRGDRYWHKKNALATLTLVGRIQTVLRDARTDGGTEKPKDEEPRGGRDEESLEREAERLEAEGVAVLRRHEKKKRGRG